MIERALLALALSSGLAHAGEPEAQVAAHEAKQVYWDCLAAATVRSFLAGMTATDFGLYVKGACPDEKQTFRFRLMAYFGLKHPDIPPADHVKSTDYVIEAAQNDVVTAFVDFKANPLK